MATISGIGTTLVIQASGIRVNLNSAPATPHSLIAEHLPSALTPAAGSAEETGRSAATLSR